MTNRVRVEYRTPLGALWVMGLLGALALFLALGWHSCNTDLANAERWKAIERDSAETYRKYWIEGMDEKVGLRQCLRGDHCWKVVADCKGSLVAECSRCGKRKP